MNMNDSVASHSTTQPRNLAPGGRRESHCLTRREVVTLAELNHSDVCGVSKRHCDVAAEFGVTRSAISQRVRRARLKLEQNPNPAARRYAAKLTEATGRRVQIMPIKLSGCDNV
jgi:hypothetical protein